MYIIMYVMTLEDIGSYFNKGERMKRYLTLLLEVVEKTVGLLTDITPINCSDCPCHDTVYCYRYKWLDCSRSIHRWLFDDLYDDNTYNKDYELGWKEGQEALREEMWEYDRD